MRRLLVPAAFAVIAIVTGASAIRGVGHAISHQSARTDLIALYQLMRTAVVVAFAVFTVQRTEPHRRARDPLALIVCAFAAFGLPLLSGPAAKDSTSFVLVGDVVAVLGCTWLLYAVFGLGRCFGVLPEARGLVTDGAYRVVRHPVYLGELTAFTGLAMAAPGLWNAALVGIHLLTQLIRMRYEERALTLAFPEYARYAARTPRLLPRVSPLFGSSFLDQGGAPSS